MGAASGAREQRVLGPPGLLAVIDRDGAGTEAITGETSSAGHEGGRTSGCTGRGATRGSLNIERRCAAGRSVLGDTQLMTLVPEDLATYFNLAGWQPGRSIALPKSITDQIPEAHPAGRILSEFSGITVGKCEAGEECATSDVAFQFIEAIDEAAVWSELLGTLLVGIATVHHNHGDLFVDSLGRYFSISSVHDATCFEGDSFADAMRRLLHGNRCRPMLRPDQQSVMMYGEEFTSNSAEVFDYSRSV